ncbi:MAG: glycoside hydrolase family 97 catalytic domain-containing protein [Prevotella sp.]|nr:glycoside hydrolase family 97 catalytic domain-containing protein [Prevotella sp.]
MKKLFFLLVVTSLTMTATARRLTSPNGKLTVETKKGQFIVNYQGQQVLYIKAAEATTPLKGLKAERVKADYLMLTGKCSHPTNEANEYRVGQMMLRLYNDGLAFRYETPVKEQAVYIIPEGTKRWMQQWCDSYEGFFPLSTTCKQKAVPSYGRQYKDAEGNCVRWGYPALLEPREGVFVLLTEANIEHGQSASSLYNDGEMFRVVPDEGENMGCSPWRVAIVGTLADVVQSTLVTDVSEPCRLEDTSWIQPGVVSWVYWAYNHGSNDYNIIKKYVDMADVLKLPYVLIDAEWDEMKDGKTIEDAVAYAQSKGVKPLIWYNSSVGWVDGAPTPKFRLNKPEDREREFAWLEKLGVAGVKIDFFSGDNQRNMDYCIDLLESAARHHLLVNFHGATIPRGWQRTYPNLMSTEGVYGAEWYNNVPTFTAKAACHNATLPFTRNVIGPMDYTPCTFSDSQHPHITTNAHELALTVLFESALQHLADRPESYLSQPKEVQQFLSQLPAAWDETRLVSGYPGESVVMARRYGATWYVAGINGTDSQLTLKTPLGFIGQGEATFYMDGEPWTISHGQTLPQTVTCKPRGGFVIVVQPKRDALPSVYDVEHTGAAFAKPALPAVADLPIQHGLPDALKGVGSFADWSKRRSEIAAQIQHYGIGEKPAVSKECVKARMDGDTLLVDVTVNGQTLTLKSEIQYPKTGTAPYALMIGTSGIALPKPLFENRPIARMVFHEKQVNDYGQWGRHHERGEHPFDRLYPDLKDNGAYSEWAWGLSRLIDGLQLLGPEITKIDTRHIGVTGCSYAGKMALYCGAFDERVALVIAQEPGGGGAAAWRASHESAKNVEDLDKTDYHWFLESQKENFHGDSVYRLPYDQHALCAMVFPRALLLLGNPDYEWLADASMLVSAKAAREVWRRFGVADRMGWSIVGGHGHCQLPACQYPEVEAFLDKFLLGRKTDTGDIRIADFTTTAKHR